MSRKDRARRSARFLHQLNDGSPHADVETRHHSIELPNGRYQRHPARKLLADQVANPCPSPIHKFEECTGPVLIIFLHEIRLATQS